MNVKRSNGGRPPGRKKTAKIEVVLKPDIKTKFMDIMDVEGKSASVEVGSWIKNYIENYEFKSKDN